MRCSAGTYIGLARSVTVWTNVTMPCLTVPSFQDGRGSVWAHAAEAAMRTISPVTAPGRRSLNIDRRGAGGRFIEGHVHPTRVAVGIDNFLLWSLFVAACFSAWFGHN